MESQSDSNSYDIDLHIEVASRLLGINPRAYVISSRPTNKELDDWIAQVFSNPNQLRAVIADLFCETQQQALWPNHLSDLRRAPINVDEIEEIQNKVDTGLFKLHGESRPEPYNPQFTGPAARRLTSPPGLMEIASNRAFFDASVELLERFMENPGSFSTKEWPIFPLISTLQFQAAFSRQDSISAFKSPKRDFSEYRKEVIDNTSGLDYSIGIQTLTLLASIRLFFAEQQIDSIPQLTRAECFKELKFWLDKEFNNLWIMGYVDFEIDRTCNLRNNIQAEEWIEILDICNLLAQKFPANPGTWLNSNASVWGIGSARGSEGPIEDRFYWAWRTGYVVAAGAHLIQDLGHDTETKSDVLEDFPSRPLALDLVVSLGNERDWEAVRKLLVDGLFEIREKLSYGESLDDGTYNSPLYFSDPELLPLNISGSGSALSWMVKIGYVDGMYDRKMAVPPKPYTDLRHALDKYPPNIQSNLANAINIQHDTAQLHELDPEQPEQPKLTESRSEQEYQKDIVELIGDGLWGEINPDAQIELLLAEKHFKEKNYPQWYRSASQHYCNAAESILGQWLTGQAENFHSTMQILDPFPKTLGQWAHYFKKHVLNVVELGNIGWPELNRVRAVRFKETCFELARYRKFAHPNDQNVVVHKARDAFFGTRIDSPNEGILELAAALSGRTA